MPDVFVALADPTRRSLLDAVAQRDDGVTATELAAALPISRQAVAKHLGVLQSAGLVSSRRTGRETRYRPTTAPLDEASAWIARLAALRERATRG
jgi:DNA-binding transcriptional ArsR family regulator